MKNKLLFSMIFIMLLFSLVGFANAVELNEPKVPKAQKPKSESTKFEIPIPTASGTKVFQNDKVIIDISNIKDGYFMVKFLEETTRGLRVRVTFPNGGNYIYLLYPGDKYTIYPLSNGNGEYKIEVMQEAAGNKYTMVLAETISVTLSDEFAPFIRPNYFVNYTKNSNAVKKAVELIKDKSDELEKVAAIYKYVIENVTYDLEFAKTVKKGYVPDVDRIMKDGTGICYDYAVLITAMLRSQGIPTKLIFGDVSNAYHAWINVYTVKSGWVDVISFDGKKWTMMDPTFASSLLGDGKKLNDFIGDGSKYDVKSTF